MQSSWYQVGLVSAHEKIAAVMQGSFSAASGSSFPKSSFARETGVWRNRRENVSVRTACIYGEQSVFSAAGLAKPAGIFKLIRKPNLVKFLNSLSLLWKLRALGSVRVVPGVRLWNSQGGWWAAFWRDWVFLRTKAYSIYSMPWESLSCQVIYHPAN